MDFTNYKKSSTYFGGSEKKLGLIISGNEYMIKFQKQTEFGKRNNHISEYIGSHIFKALGFECQETYLGTYDGEQVVACKSFICDGYQFVPFNDVGESTLDQDKEKYQYSYEDIMHMLRDNSKLTNVDETIGQFWKLFIVDALLGNFDRHGANWGFLKKDNKYKLAPIFDNGSSLFPNLVDEDEMLNIINSEEETNKRIYAFPTSQIKLNGKKSSYYDVISSLQFKECNIALADIYAKIDLEQIYSFIDNDVLFISDIQKRFYKHMITERFIKIIKVSYDKLIGVKK
ncbi:MAG: HipA domain-containing protein [Eubacteriales bacterium]|nr:HipA domain-containing protein [Eubacteriales bacterium]